MGCCFEGSLILEPFLYDVSLLGLSSTTEAPTGSCLCYLRGQKKYLQDELDFQVFLGGSYFGSCPPSSGP